ncbi:hypothetical protein F5J12DRAFT_831427 [Pisolithus orientalis]|uniref:uncharacterized protein n=1 Tax=Pisolithus orientalis TaxID=936130 RepID=UPI002224EFD4|nr:uncharacterized protein F5J12DRAFT_831427 [Pisolithus orientalis]KAI6006542.1 hypothetical protein F5J12DRAFT_831427 [Pisolithus orientalis]
MQKLRRSLATSLRPHFLTRSVSGFYTLPSAPFPRFTNGCLILSCIAHRVTAVQLKVADPSAPSYTYKIQAFGLKPLEIALPDKLENATGSQGSLQVVRPWHPKSLVPTALDLAVNEEKLLSTLGRPFNALLLSRLPFNEHKRIAILRSKVEIFNIV